MKARKIKTKIDLFLDTPADFTMWGCLDGKDTYIAFGDKDHGGYLKREKLYRLAKAIVKEFEAEK